MNVNQVTNYKRDFRETNVVQKLQDPCLSVPGLSRRDIMPGSPAGRIAPKCIKLVFLLPRGIRAMKMNMRKVEPMLHF